MVGWLVGWGLAGWVGQCLPGWMAGKITSSCEEPISSSDRSSRKPTVNNNTHSYKPWEDN